MGNRGSQQQEQSAIEALTKRSTGAEQRRCNPSSTSFLSSPWLLLLLSNLRFQLKGQNSTFQRQGRETRQLCSSDWSATREPASTESLMPTQTTLPTSTTSTTGYSRAVSMESGSCMETYSTTGETPWRTTSGRTGRTTARTCSPTSSTRHPACATPATRGTC